MPTPRPRATGFVAGKRCIISMYSPPAYKQWQQEAGKLLHNQTAVLFEGPVAVELTVEVSRPKTTKLSAPKPDVDNYAKGVLDAITKDGRFWLDDSQVVDLHVTKAWTTGTPGIHVAIRTP